MSLRVVLAMVLAAAGAAASAAEEPADTASALDSWYILPAVAHMPGKNGTFWQTDVAIVNPYPSRELFVNLWFLPENQDNSSSAVLSRLEVEPGGQVLLTDVVANTFGFEQAAGSMVLKSRDRACFFVSSRTYTGETTTYGMMEAGQPRVTSGSKSSFIGHVRNDSRFRSNVGVAAARGRSVDVLVEAYDSNGRLKGEKILRVKPWSSKQVGLDSFATSFSNGYLMLTGLCSTDEAKWLGYATTIDNVSGDSTFLAAKTDEQYTWVESSFNQSGWWEGSVSSSGGSLSGYLSINQTHGRFEATMHDRSGATRFHLSGYEHLGAVHLKYITVYNAMCAGTEVVGSAITSASDAIYGHITLFSINPDDCPDGVMTLYFSPLDESPFGSETETSSTATASESVWEEPHP